MKAPATHDCNSDISADGDDSIMEVAQSPKKVYEIDLTNSPNPLITTKLIPRTKPTPPLPLGAAETSCEEIQSHDTVEASAGIISCLIKGRMTSAVLFQKRVRILL